jgi:hypothetical protein
MTTAVATSYARLLRIGDATRQDTLQLWVRSRADYANGPVAARKSYLIDDGRQLGRSRQKPERDVGRRRNDWCRPKPKQCFDLVNKL